VLGDGGAILPAGLQHRGQCPKALLYAPHRLLDLMARIQQAVAQDKALGEQAPCLLEQRPCLLVQPLTVGALAPGTLQLRLQASQRIEIVAQLEILPARILSRVRSTLWIGGDM
jgi:hypothetical protein